MRAATTRDEAVDQLVEVGRLAVERGLVRASGGKLSARLPGETAFVAAEEARGHDCVVLSHHGCSALGPDVGMAFRRALNPEEAATATYRCLLGDTTTCFPPEALADLRHGRP